MMQEHESFQQAEKDWAACMKRSGYDFKHRSETGSVVAGADLQRQREMGRLDLNCVEETNFTGRAMAVDVAIQKNSSARTRPVCVQHSTFRKRSSRGQRKH